MWRALTCMSQLWLFHLGLGGEGSAAPAEPLLPLFDAVGCALVGAVVCRDPRELEAVPGVGLVVFPRHFCQSTNGCSRFQPMCVSALGLLTPL